MGKKQEAFDFPVIFLLSNHPASRLLRPRPRGCVIG